MQTDFVMRLEDLRSTCQCRDPAWDAHFESRGRSPAISRLDFREEVAGDSGRPGRITRALKSRIMGRLSAPLVLELILLRSSSKSALGKPRSLLQACRPRNSGATTSWFSPLNESAADSRKVPSLMPWGILRIYSVQVGRSDTH